MCGTSGTPCIKDDQFCKSCLIAEVAIKCPGGDNQGEVCDADTADPTNKGLHKLCR
jgi:hypothetical protein